MISYRQADLMRTMNPYTQWEGKTLWMIVARGTLDKSISKDHIIESVTDQVMRLDDGREFLVQAKCFKGMDDTHVYYIFPDLEEHILCLKGAASEHSYGEISEIKNCSVYTHQGKEFRLKQMGDAYPNVDWGTETVTFYQ